MGSYRPEPVSQKMTTTPQAGETLEQSGTGPGPGM